VRPFSRDLQGLQAWRAAFGGVQMRRAAALADHFDRAGLAFAAQAFLLTERQLHRGVMEPDGELYACDHLINAEHRLGRLDDMTLAHAVEVWHSRRRLFC
jgi:hypothetical protein